MNSPKTLMSSSEELSNYNAEEAKDEISDLLTQIEGHDLWIKEQSSSTETRLNAFKHAIKQSDRLKQMLSDENQPNQLSQQQYELILALKNDFLKAIAQIQDDLVTAHRGHGQSFSDSKMQIRQLTQENEQFKYKMQQQNMQIALDQESINKLRVENERLQRLKDLLMQQQDAMNQRLSQVKGKDVKIKELKFGNEELKQCINIMNQEKQTLNNNFKLQIESLNTSCKQLLDENKAFKQEHAHKISMQAQTEELRTKCDEFEAKYNELLQENMNDNTARQEEVIALEEEHNAKVEILEEDKEKLQHQFTVLLQEKSDLQQECQSVMEKYEKLGSLNTQTIETNLDLASQIDKLKENMDKLVFEGESVKKNELDAAVLQSKIEQLSVQINAKNKQISEQQTRGEEMHNQRETLQHKLQESQQSLLNYQTQCQGLETELAEKRNKYPSPTGNTENKLSSDDLLSFVTMNNKLKPIDESVTDIITKWQYNTQIFVLDDNEEIKENDFELISGGEKEWKLNENVFENVLSEINAMRENNPNENEAQQQFCTLFLDLISEKVSLLKHLGCVHISKGTQISQIMCEAQKRISSLHVDLIKKNNEMEMHLKAKQKMYDEIKGVHEKVENLTREYQTIVNELDHVRQGRKGSVDSSFSP